MPFRSSCFGLVACAFFLAALTAGQAVQAQEKHEDSGLYAGIRAIGSFAQMDGISSQGFAGPQQVENDSDDVAGPAGVVGYVFKPIPLQIELETGYRVRFDLDVRDLAPSGTVDYEINVATFQVLLNALLRWRNSTDFTPYLGGSVGWARNSADTQRTVLNTQVQVSRDEDRDNLAWGVMVGVDWRFASSWSADLAYRYIDLGEVRTATFATGETIEADDYTSHDVLLGVKYHF